jgi:hypothetical protein
MAIVRSNKYNDPAIGAIFENIAGMFAPPSAGDTVNYAQANEINQKVGIIEKLKSDPRYAGADGGVLAGLFTPPRGFYAQDQNNATAIRGQDVLATTSRMKQRRRQSALLRDRHVPAAGTGRGPSRRPARHHQPVRRARRPAAGGRRGQTALRDRARGALIESAPTLPDNQLIALTMGPTPVENIVGPDGTDAADRLSHPGGRQQPAYAPNKETITDDGYGKPGDGLVWARNTDNSVQLDERGAPIAIPYQGGSAWQDEQDALAAAEAGADKDATKQSVVLQNLDRALTSITSNPAWTTALAHRLPAGRVVRPLEPFDRCLTRSGANISFDQLQDMRDASPTGGALRPSHRARAFVPPERVGQHRTRGRPPSHR